MIKEHDLMLRDPQRPHSRHIRLADPPQHLSPARVVGARVQIRDVDRRVEFREGIALQEGVGDCGWGGDWAVRVRVRVRVGIRVSGWVFEAELARPQIERLRGRTVGLSKHICGWEGVRAVRWYGCEGRLVWDLYWLHCRPAVVVVVVVVLWGVACTCLCLCRSRSGTTLDGIDIDVHTVYLHLVALAREHDC